MHSKIDQFIFLHGFLGAPPFWSVVEKEMLRQNIHFAATLPQLPGHRDSSYFTRSAMHPQKYDDAIDWLVKIAAPTAPNWIFGYSMGARLALAAVLKFPQLFYGAILLSVQPGIPNDDERAKRLRFEQLMQQQLTTGTIEEFVDDFAALPIFASQQSVAPNILAAQRAVRCSHNPKMISLNVGLLGLGSTPPLSAQIERNQVPIRLLTGEIDTKYFDIAQKLTQKNKCITHRVIPNAGHNVLLEAPQETTKQIIHFVRQISLLNH